MRRTSDLRWLITTLPTAYTIGFTWGRYRKKIRAVRPARVRQAS